jgi:hypothetical protein
MASKHHKAIAGHVKNMRQHAAAINDSADKIEQVLAALRGGDQGEEQQQAPSGVSPLGGQAA